MKKRIIKIGGDGTIGITFDKEDKSWYQLVRGDFVIFTIQKVYGSDKKLKYSKTKTEEE